MTDILIEKEESSFCMSEIGCDPDVRGWRLLVKSMDVPEKVGSLYVSDEYKKTQELRQNIGRVLKIGRTAFTERFEDLRCKEGDWVHYSILEREPIYANGFKCYYINDDKLFAVLKPEEVHMYLDARK
jgi:co-chaperonin GroES (HSP10)